MSTFEAFPKVPRWNREVVITEKVDGTNAAIIVTPIGDLLPSEGIFFGPHAGLEYARLYCVQNVLDFVSTDGGDFAVYAQSRTRLIHAGADNFGFAAWVQKNAEELVKLLGPGRHFGEWYGQGIQRNYGLDHKRFALFNTKRWEVERRALRPAFKGPRYQIHPTLPIDVVAVLGRINRPDDLYIGETLEWLEINGSVLVPGFKKPEGVVLYHTAANQTFKILLEGDELPKSVATKQEKELAA